MWCVSGFRSRPGLAQTPNHLTVMYLLPSLFHPTINCPPLSFLSIVLLYFFLSRLVSLVLLPTITLSLHSPHLSAPFVCSLPPPPFPLLFLLLVL